MREALLDTDILSEVFKGQNLVVQRRLVAYLAHHPRLTISALSVLEICYGLERAGREHQLERYLTLLGGIEVLPLDREEAEIAGRIQGQLERNGRSIGRADPMIAAVAIVQRRVLVTGNLAHYQFIVEAGYDLALDNWRSP